MIHSTGLFTQPAVSVIEDVDEFYTGGTMPWFCGTEPTDDGRIQIILWHPDHEDGSRRVCYIRSAQQIKDAVTTARQQGSRLCCLDDILGEQLGMGCVDDFGIIIQTACYGKLVFG